MTQEKKTTEKKVPKRRFEGVVVSVSENKTIHVLVAENKMHPKYRKQYTTTRKFPVHDENNQVVLGNKVVFEGCRPYSKTKRWRVVKILK